MYKSTLFIFLLSGLVSLAAAQQPVRYKDYVFSKVFILKDIFYKSKVEPLTLRKHGMMDVYLPAGDKAAKRPLIIWVHGGGFKFGTKKSGGTPLWCRTFARRGYVCAAINYRLSHRNPLGRFRDLVSGCYDAVEDLAQTVAFFKANHELYRIDTNRIFLAGNSAGGMTVLQAVFSSYPAMAELAGRKADDTLSKKPPIQHIAAVANFWGGIYDTLWLKNTKTPIVGIHGTRDRIVPVEKSGISSLYGNAVIERNVKAFHLTGRFKYYKGYGHELHRHFNPFATGPSIRKRWLESGRFVADFFYPYAK